MNETTVQALRGQLRGELITPADPTYETARKVCNGMIDRRPALIARCRDAADVMAGIGFAREHGMLLAVRGGAHNGPGLGTCDGGLALDLSPMRTSASTPQAAPSGSPGARAKVMNLHQSAGLLVQQVAKGSPAELLGLRGGTISGTVEGQNLTLGGDVVLSVAGIKVETADSLQQIRARLSQMKRGETLRATVMREGRILELNALLP